MSEEATNKSSRTWRYIASTVVALPLFYVLSYGPVAVLGARKLISHDVLEFYKIPIVFLVGKAGTEFGLTAYLKVWFAITGTPWPW